LPLLGPFERLDRASTIREFRIVIVDDRVKLPQIEVVGTQSAERFFKHLHGDGSVTTVSARLVAVPPFSA
jgi:hypothetical protein